MLAQKIYFSYEGFWKWNIAAAHELELKGYWLSEGRDVYQIFMNIQIFWTFLPAQQSVGKWSYALILIAAFITSHQEWKTKPTAKAFKNQKKKNSKTVENNINKRIKTKVFSEHEQFSFVCIFSLSQFFHHIRLFSTSNVLPCSVHLYFSHARFKQD